MHKGFLIALFLVPLAAQAAPETTTSPLMAAGQSTNAKTLEKAAKRGEGIPVQFQGVNRAKLSSQMEGQIIQISKKLGQSFHKGNTLIKFACEKEKAALKSAFASQQQAGKVVQSKKQLVSMHAAPQLQLDKARADLSKAKAQYAAAGARVDDCRVKAPFDGRVSRVYVNNWETVQQGQPLIEIVNDSDLQLSALLPSSWLAWLKIGLTFKVDVNELNKTVEAKITALGASIDPVSHTIPIKATVVNGSDKLLPGMSGRAYFSEAKGG